VPVRSDISVDWVASPRVITVLAPSTSLSMQDLVDTCRVLEMDPVWFDEDHLIDASGKDQIDVGVYVGITACLRNAVVSFEARTGPAWAICKIVGGNLVAKDALGVYMDPRLHMAFTSIDVEKSTSAALLSGSGGATPEEIREAVLDGSVAGRPPGSLGATVKSTDQGVIDVADQVSDLAAQVTGVAGQVTGVADQVDDVGDQVTGVGVQATDIANRVEDVVDTTDDLHDEALGRWVLNPTAKTLTLYRQDGSVLRTFNLTLAAADVPAFVERVPA